jgi:hypothetical protein
VHDVGPPRQVHDGLGQRLVEGHQGIAEPPDAHLVAQRLAQGTAERQRRVLTTLAVLGGLTDRLRAGWSSRSTDEGASTLELVILVLGLIAVATLLVATLTAAVRSRTDQIQ